MSKKKFAYCIGGCRAVPPYLDVLTSERSDCFPVFFKEPGPKGSLFLPNSTTNTGRNLAFSEAAKGDYEYVIIMDDDIEFTDGNAEGFRKFEALIDEFNPPIAVPRYSWHLQGQNKYSHLNTSKRLQGLNASDAIINAFHRDTWWALLPYWTGADADSWWNAQQVLHRISAFLYPGGYIQFNDLEVKNLISGPYPRQGQCVAADAYVEEMTLPDWKPHITKYRAPESFHEVMPFLRDRYTLTCGEAGRFFNLGHPYWANRKP